MWSMPTIYGPGRGTHRRAAPRGAGVRRPPADLVRTVRWRWSTGRGRCRHPGPRLLTSARGIGSCFALFRYRTLASGLPGGSFGAAPIHGDAPGRVPVGFAMVSPRVPAVSAV